MTSAAVQDAVTEHVLARRRAAEESRRLAPPPPVFGEFAGRPPSNVVRARQHAESHANAARRLGVHVDGIRTLFGPAVAHPLELLVEDVTENAGEAFHAFERSLDELDMDATRGAERLGQVGLQRDRLLSLIVVAGAEIRRRYRGKVPEAFQALLDVEPF